MNIEKKIITIKNLYQKKHEKIVICYGFFNIIHPGHIRYLEFARSFGSKLIVALQSKLASENQNLKTVFADKDRAFGVASLSSVDNVIILNEINLKQLVAEIKPNYLIVGEEFKKNITNSIKSYNEDPRPLEVSSTINTLEKFGGKLLFHEGETNYASSELLNDNVKELSDERFTQLKNVLNSKNVKLKDLKQTTNNFQKASILVIGDLIVDQYVACDALGMSAEAPIVVVRELKTKEYVGGAGIVACHVKSLGADCHFLSVTGDDHNSEFVENKLNELRIKNTLIRDISRPTTFKIRYMVDNQKMFRVSRLKEHFISEEIEEKLINEIRLKASKLNGIIISDFNYGVITERVLNEVMIVSKKYNLPTFADCQSSSQIGDISKFRNINLLTATEREVRLSLNSKSQSLEIISNKIINRTKCRNFILKLGAEGFISYTKGNNERHHFPALSVNPLDTSGAGDSMLALISVGLSSGANFFEVCALSAFVTSLAVENLGNEPVKINDLINFIGTVENLIE